MLCIVDLTSHPPSYNHLNNTPFLHLPWEMFLKIDYLIPGPDAEEWSQAEINVIIQIFYT